LTLLFLEEKFERPERKKRRIDRFQEGGRKARRILSLVGKNDLKKGKRSQGTLSARSALHRPVGKDQTLDVLNSSVHAKEKRNGARKKKKGGGGTTVTARPQPDIV